MRKKALSLMLALVTALAILPALPAGAAGINPWTGRWTMDGGANTSDIVFWQDGDDVVGAHIAGNQRYEFKGTLSGNVLTGTATLRTGSGGEPRPISLTLSSDGSMIIGNAGFASTNINVKKIVDYSELTPSYTKSENMSFSGMWYLKAGQSSWGGTLIVQNKDSATVIMSRRTFEGTVSGNVLTATSAGPEDKGDTIKFTMSADGMSFTYEEFYKSGSLKNYGIPPAERLSRITYIPAELNASDWAKPYLEKAGAYELIPDCLKGPDTDFTKPVTRAEFAAVCVKLYENLSGEKAAAPSVNPFTDTNDAEVLKSYHTSLMVGTSDTTFDPDTQLNREQAATALTRVLKRIYIPGWTFKTDGSYTLNFTMPAKFADDDKISSWAYESVYFMAANDIILGTGNNMFSPRAVTSAEQAANYAGATREMALIIATRIVDNLKAKPLDYNVK